MSNKHHLICLAPICSCDPNVEYPKQVLWLPGEEVCRKGPFKPFQLQQILINKSVKKGTWKNMDKSYAAEELTKDYLTAQRSKQRRKQAL